MEHKPSIWVLQREALQGCDSPSLFRRCLNFSAVLFVVYSFRARWEIRKIIHLYHLSFSILAKGLLDYRFWVWFKCVGRWREDIILKGKGTGWWCRHTERFPFRLQIRSGHTNKKQLTFSRRGEAETGLLAQLGGMVSATPTGKYQ